MMIRRTVKAHGGHKRLRRAVSQSSHYLRRLGANDLLQRQPVLRLRVVLGTNQTLHISCEA